MLIQQLLLWQIERVCSCSPAHAHSGAGHTSFVSKTVPRAAHADEFLGFFFFSILIKIILTPIFSLPHQNEVIKTSVNDSFRSLDSGLEHRV